MRTVNEWLLLKTVKKNKKKGVKEIRIMQCFSLKHSKEF